MAKLIERHRALAVHAAVAAGINLFLIAIWGLTSHGYFWPAWTILALALPVAIHAWVIMVDEHPEFWRERRLDRGFGVHAGVWLSLLGFLIGAWVASGFGYFWPVWVALLAAVALGPHAAILLMRDADRDELTERISVLERSRAGAVDVQEAELRRIERDL
ncbi:MAG TPA: 2TM domain-containing protein, partial [Solirubrobacteraceae bacterium]